MKPKQRNLSIFCCCFFALNVDLLSLSTVGWSIDRSTFYNARIASTDEGAASIHRAPSGLPFLENKRKRRETFVR